MQESIPQLMTSLRSFLAQRFPALASRDFAIFLVGHLLSLIGSSMQNTALPLLAYRISGRPFDLGLIGFAVTLPTFFLALPGGVLIEHVDKRKAIIVLQTIMMLDTFALAFLALSGVIQIWQIVITSLILGVATAFEITARQAMLIELVGRELTSECHRFTIHCLQYLASAGTGAGCNHFADLYKKRRRLDIPNQRH